MSQFIQDACSIFEASVAGVQPQALLKKMQVEEVFDIPTADFRRVLVIGAGKASTAMAGAVEEWLGREVDEGLVVVPHGYRLTLPATAQKLRRIEVVEAGHPVPDQIGIAAAERVIDLTTECGKYDLLIVLLSGGGSALWPAFAEPISLDEAQEVFKLLLQSGADIQEINTVRKHISRISGGRLVAMAAPATVRAMVLSDVVGNDLSVIASGPTVPDASTFADAVAVLQTYQLWESIPASVQNHLEAGLCGSVAESPKSDCSAFEHARTVLLGSNRDALAAAQRQAESLGYATQIVSADLTGEARNVGRHLAQQALNINESQPRCLLWGGESTVTVAGGGKGGRIRK
jgi:hydroxypyruvate reductase